MITLLSLSLSVTLISLSPFSRAHLSLSLSPSHPSLALILQTCETQPPGGHSEPTCPYAGLDKTISRGWLGQLSLVLPCPQTYWAAGAGPCSLQKTGPCPCQWPTSRSQTACPAPCSAGRPQRPQASPTPPPCALSHGGCTLTSALTSGCCALTNIPPGRDACPLIRAVLTSGCCAGRKQRALLHQAAESDQSGDDIRLLCRWRPDPTFATTLACNNSQSDVAWLNPVSFGALRAAFRSSHCHKHG